MASLLGPSMGIHLGHLLEQVSVRETMSELKSLQVLENWSGQRWVIALDSPMVSWLGILSGIH